MSEIFNPETATAAAMKEYIEANAEQVTAAVAIQGTPARWGVDRVRTQFAAGFPAVLPRETWTGNRSAKLRAYTTSPARSLRS
jgi:hypothetical protein